MSWGDHDSPFLWEKVLASSCFVWAVRELEGFVVIDDSHMSG